MTQFEERDLGEPSRGGRRRQLGTSRWPLILGLVVLAAGVGVVLYLRSSTPEPQVLLPAPMPSPAPAAEERVLPPLPAREITDAEVRKAVSGVGKGSAFASWLANDDLLRRFVGAAVAVSQGESPRVYLSFMGPTEPFAVKKQGAAATIDPKSYRRYDAIAGIIDGLDAQAAAGAYKQLKPLLDRAYAELGPKHGSLHEALARGITRLLATPIPEGPVEVVEGRVLWQFKDPALEALSPADKQFLRIGPANMRTIKAKLRELASACGLAITEQARATDAARP